MNPFFLIAVPLGIIAAKKDPWAVIATSTAVLLPFPLSIPFVVYFGIKAVRNIRSTTRKIVDASKH